MPALNITFTQDELDRVHELARRNGQAVKPYVHDMALADDYMNRVMQAALKVAERSAELNRRLA